MGSGTKRPTARPAQKRTVLAGGDGIPVLSCPDDDRLHISRLDVEAGTAVILELLDGSIVIRSNHQIVGEVSADQFASLAKCLAHGFVYHGEAEVEDGESFVHFWIVA